MTNGKNSCLLEMVAWNCRGILKLQKKQYSEAIACFSVGLGGASIQTRNISELYSPNINLLFANRNMIISVELSQEEQGPIVNEGDNFDFALFKQALHLSYDEIENLLSGAHEGYYDRLLCGISFYNIGLAHHLEALETCISNDLLNAMNFYGLAYETLAIHQLLLNEKISQQSTGHGRSNLAFLALANNTAHIHAFCRNVAATKECSKEIIHGLVLAAGTDAVVFHELYSEFVLNLVFFRAVENFPAPAA
jgi:hypothetical protein